MQMGTGDVSRTSNRSNSLSSGHAVPFVDFLGIQVGKARAGAVLVIQFKYQRTPSAFVVIPGGDHAGGGRNYRRTNGRGNVHAVMYVRLPCQGMDTRAEQVRNAPTGNGKEVPPPG